MEIIFNERGSKVSVYHQGRKTVFLFRAMTALIEFSEIQELQNVFEKKIFAADL